MHRSKVIIFSYYEFTATQVLPNKFPDCHRSWPTCNNKSRPNRQVESRWQLGHALPLRQLQWGPATLTPNLPHCTRHLGLSNKQIPAKLNGKKTITWPGVSHIQIQPWAQHQEPCGGHQTHRAATQRSRWCNGRRRNLRPNPHNSPSQSPLLSLCLREHPNYWKNIGESDHKTRQRRGKTKWNE